MWSQTVPAKVNIVVNIPRKDLLQKIVVLELASRICPPNQIEIISMSEHPRRLNDIRI